MMTILPLINFMQEWGLIILFCFILFFMFFPWYIRQLGRFFTAGIIDYTIEKLNEECANITGTSKKQGDFDGKK